MIKKKILLFACFLGALPLVIAAQVTDPEKQYTAFDMRHNGKIYVVVGVLLIILIGVLLYLIRIDRKITTLEKENKIT
jgi:hypothetical protein